MSKRSRGQARRRKSSPSLNAVKWIAALGLVALVVYAVSQVSGVAYGEDAIGVVNFSALNPGLKYFFSTRRETCWRISSF